jgi:hypothetical protein
MISEIDAVIEKPADSVLTKVLYSCTAYIFIVTQIDRYYSSRYVKN